VQERGRIEDALNARSGDEVEGASEGDMMEEDELRLLVESKKIWQDELQAIQKAWSDMGGGAIDG